ncbi:hypothetical protein CR973_00885 [Candidatus Saccharibacteria bacterium]|nr:MAG: hypothetical protein CR973_00885 [Candidatus Saccharibacteria bacterium]
MSRVLAELLGAHELPFRQQIQQLERAAGLPSADVRLTAHIMQATRDKIGELGLDPADTTGPELYGVLQERLRRDEVLVRAAMNLRADILPADVLAQTAKRLQKLARKDELFVMKQAVAKKIIRKLKPKATMKRLGYRSMESMLKHESVPQLLAACQATESADWHDARLQLYKKLQPKDFELRKPQCIVPSGKQWPKLTQAHAQQHKNNIIAVPELGAIIILPLEHDLPGLAITTFIVSLHALNDMRALSAYLKLQQLRPGFGDALHAAIIAEPLTDVELAGEKLPWKIVHWFYGHGHVSYRPDVFEPHAQPEDFAWHSAGTELAALQPVLAFWQQTDMLGLLDSGGAVSLNVLDVALGLCNGLSYTERVVHNMRETLRRELLARYIHEDNLQQMLSGALEKQLTPELDFDA